MEDTAQSRWKDLECHRSMYLRRAVDASKLTIPTLIPESDQSSGDFNANQIPSLYQGAGARGVSSLAAKLLLALMPPSQPFFRLTIDAGKVRNWIQQQGTGQSEPDVLSKLDQLLSSMERQILMRFDKLQARNAVFEAVKHLLVGGNALLYVGADSVRMYGMRSFVLDRDPEGNVTEIVIREQVAEKFMPAKEPGDSGDDGDDDREDVYTHVTIDPTDEQPVQWYQEYDGTKLRGTAGFSQLDANPWIPLRLHRVAGEYYGRGLVEEVIGDLQSLESLTKAIVQGSLIAAKAIGLVNPNGVTRADVLARAENGAIVPGNAADVEFLQVQKNNDFSTALSTMQLIERRLQYTFLTNEAVQRDAERVTAEEIRLMAESLEQGLGGVYSVLSAELQLPLIRRVLSLMMKEGDLPEIPKGLVEPQVTTGLEAIGRGNDKQRLTQFLSTVAASLGPQVFVQYINPTELIRRFAAADGIDTAGLVKDEQAIQAEQAQQQQAMLGQQLAQGAIQSGATQAPTAGGPTGPSDAGASAGAGAAGTVGLPEGVGA
jgi:hypothetical protein